MTPRIRAGMQLTAVPAAAVAVLLLRFTPVAPADPVLMLVLVMLGAAAANFPVMVLPRYKTDTGPAIDLAFVLLFSPATAVALVGLTRILGDGVLCIRRNPETGTHRRSPIDLVFNTSQLMVAAGCAAIIYRGVMGSATMGSGLPAQLVAAALAATALYVVSTSAVLMAAGHMLKRGAFDLWAEAARVELKQTGAIYIAGYLLAVLSNGRPLLAIVMMGPIAALQLALNRSTQLREQ